MVHVYTPAAVQDDFFQMRGDGMGRQRAEGAVEVRVPSKGQAFNRSRHVAQKKVHRVVKKVEGLFEGH
jgi:hypothetical protein